jgi:hypothetical protein
MLKHSVHPLWAACVFFRVWFATEITRSTYDPYNAIVLTVMGTGFLYKYVFGSNNEVQIAKVFWHNTRIVHACFYLLAATSLLIPFWSVYGGKNYSSTLLFLQDRHMYAQGWLLLDIAFSIVYRFVML